MASGKWLSCARLIAQDDALLEDRLPRRSEV